MKNREIKFRVWNTYQEKFYNQSEIAFTADGVLLFWDWHNDNGKSWAHDCYNSYNGGLFSIQQFTGFTNNEGEEIYEGDILVFTFGEEGNEFDPFREVRDVVIFDQYNGWKFNGKALFHYRGAKIIGNIFENPELLNETK